MKMTFAAIGILLSGWLAYANHNMPLIYAVIGLGLLDVLLNLKDEQALLQKMGKNLAAVLLPVVVGVLARNYTDSTVAINAALVVVVAAELSSVGPAVVAFVKKAGNTLIADLPKADQKIARAYETDVVKFVEHLSPEEINTLIGKLTTAYSVKTGATQETAATTTTTKS